MYRRSAKLIVRRRHRRRLNVPRRPQRRAKRSGNRPALGTLIRKSVMNVLSYIPGYETFKSVADFAFTALKIPAHLTGTEATPLAVGLNTALGLNRIVFMYDSPDLVKDESKWKQIMATHHYCVIREAVMRLSCQNKSGDRQGHWAMAFYPLGYSQAYNVISSDLASGVTYADLIKIPGAATF